MGAQRGARRARDGAGGAGLAGAGACPARARREPARLSAHRGPAGPRGEGGPGWGRRGEPGLGGQRLARGATRKKARKVPPFRGDGAGAGGRGAACHPGGEKGARGCRGQQVPGCTAGKERRQRRGLPGKARVPRSPAGGARCPAAGNRCSRPHRGDFLGGRPQPGLGCQRSGKLSLGRRHLLPKDGVSFWNEEGEAKSSFQLAGTVGCYASRFGAVVGLLYRSTLL